MTFTEVHVKWLVILADRLGPEAMLEIEEQVVHRVRLRLKVPGMLSDLNALLTRKLLMFLSHLNEISGARGNICLISGSLRRILRFLRMTFLTARFCGWSFQLVPLFLTWLRSQNPIDPLKSLTTLHASPLMSSIV